MKLLTYNMGGLLLENYTARLEALGRLVLSKKPEFVALQNMSIDGIKTLRTLPWATRYNSILSPPATYDTRKKSKCVIMSIYSTDQKLMEFNYRDPDTDRHLLWVDFILNDKQKQPHKLTIGTTEIAISTPTDVMEKYLNQALFVSQSHEDCFIMGDFAIVEAINGRLSLQGNWKDAWEEINGADSSNGHSFDPPNNSLVKEKTLPSFRPDRVIYNTRRYKVVGVELVGVDPDETLGSHISNHYGVMSTFALLESPLPPVPPPEVPCILEELKD